MPPSPSVSAISRATLLAAIKRGLTRVELATELRVSYWAVRDALRRERLRMPSGRSTIGWARTPPRPALLSVPPGHSTICTGCDHRVVLGPGDPLGQCTLCWTARKMATLERRIAA